MKLLIVGAFAREKAKWDTPFMVFVDEAQNFINLSFKDIYYELRKYGISLVLMHQELEQLNEVKGLVNAIYNNVGTSITFTVGDLDSPFFEGKYGPRVDRNDLMNLPSRYGYCKLLVNGHTSDTFNIYSLDRPELSKEDSKKSVEQILEYNKKGRMHIDEIDKMIRDRFEQESNEVEEEVSFIIDDDSIESEAEIEEINVENQISEEDAEVNIFKPKQSKSLWDEVES